MNFGFVIDNSRCIGCHACSTACKSENEVPLGVNRTWVKYVESGRYPDVRRNFQVTRCNHCANPPCVRICPTGAMHQRDDGIVDFDGDACIGCKACTQACPYDAIYIDPDSHTAAKCNFCVHRVDVGLEPACVVVCPEHAIIAGDLDDPASEISSMVAKHNTTVRRPEQGTSPKLFYIEGSELALHPDAGIRPGQYMWADARGESRSQASAPQATFVDARGATQRRPAPQGLPPNGPITVGGRMAEHMVQTSLNAHHPIQWHWQIPAYLVTKHIAGGLAVLMSVAALTSVGGGYELGLGVWGGLLALVMLAVTLVLLILDLDRPDRFFYLLIRPQWKSWVARAAWILAGFNAVLGAWWAMDTAAWFGLIDTGLADTLRTPLAIVTFPLAVLAATYTAFLFAQAEGRDLWQGAHVPLQMAAQAVVMGGAALASLATFGLVGAGLGGLGVTAFGVGLVASLVITLVGDLAVPHPSEAARRAGRELTRGKWSVNFWAGGVVAGHALPLALLASGVAALVPVAFASAALGLLAYAYAFVMAPQELPNS